MGPLCGLSGKTNCLNYLSAASINEAKFAFHGELIEHIGKLIGETPVINECEDGIYALTQPII